MKEEEEDRKDQEEEEEEEKKEEFVFAIQPELGEEDFMTMPTIDSKYKDVKGNTLESNLNHEPIGMMYKDDFVEDMD